MNKPLLFKGYVEHVNFCDYIPRLESLDKTIVITIYPCDVGSQKRAWSKCFGFHTALNARRSAEKKALLLGGTIIWNPFDEEA